jgi:Microcystin-dependent protein
MNEYYIGTILPWPSRWVPNGWLLCDGKAYQATDYQLLFAVIQFTYGGDGRTQFKVPNLCGNIPIGSKDNTYLGETGGLPYGALNNLHLPQHSHEVPPIYVPDAFIPFGGEVNVACNLNVELPVNASDVPGNLVAKPSANTTLGIAATTDNKKVNSYTTNQPNVVISNPTVKASGTATGYVTGMITSEVTASATVANTGLSSPIQIMQSYIVMNYIICYNGYFPPRASNSDENREKQSEEGRE